MNNGVRQEGCSEEGSEIVPSSLSTEEGEILPPSPDPPACLQTPKLIFPGNNRDFREGLRWEQGENLCIGDWLNMSFHF